VYLLDDARAELRAGPDHDIDVIDSRSMIDMPTAGPAAGTAQMRILVRVGVPNSNNTPRNVDERLA